jgi:hypothetical protein
LTDEFSSDPAKATQWSAFLRKGKLESQSVTLVEVTELLQAFLLPPVEALRAGDPFEVRWAAGGCPRASRSTPSPPATPVAPQPATRTEPLGDPKSVETTSA